MVPLKVHKLIVNCLNGEVDDIVPIFGKDPSTLDTEFKRRHAVNDKASFPKFAKMIVDCLIPLRLRHLINKAKTHEFGKKELNWKFCEAVKSKFMLEIVFFSDTLSCIRKFVTIRSIEF
jgi:hypothetical protein